VPPWLLITGESKPNKIAPLYNLGSSFFLNFFRLFIEINEPSLPNIELAMACFNSLVIKLAVPSAVFKATLPENPSATITFTSAPASGTTLYIIYLGKELTNITNPTTAEVNTLIAGAGHQTSAQVTAIAGDEAAALALALG